MRTAQYSIKREAGMMFVLCLASALTMAGSARHSPASPPSILREYLAREHLQGRFAAYKPNFHVEEFAPGKWWILDGTTHVGLVVRDVDFAELDNFNPCHPLPNAPFPRLYHAPTQLGDRLTMAETFLPKPTRASYKFEGMPARATLRIVLHFADGRFRRKTLTWEVDPDFGYILHCVDEFRSREPGNFEFCNFLPKGTTDDRLEFKRYSYILWQHPGGQILRWNQSNIGATLPGNKDMTGQRLIRTGGFIGYFGEKDRSPALEILKSTPGTTSTTCPNMLDEHIMWRPGDPARCERDEAGRYVSRAIYNLVSLPPEVSIWLAQKARLIDLYMGHPPTLSYWGFTQGVPTDFETKLDPAGSFRGVAFAYPEDDPRAPISVVSDCAHSGTHSLRMRANGRPVKFLTDFGTVHVTEGRHYRLYAWVKTDLTSGQAVLRADECLFTFNNITAVHTGQPITGLTGWHEVSLDFTPGKKAHAVILYVLVTGHGTVWVDDFLLKEFSDFEK